MTSCIPTPLLRRLCVWREGCIFVFDAGDEAGFPVSLRDTVVYCFRCRGLKRHGYFPSSLRGEESNGV